jgi:hypothetical protein
MTPIPPWHPRVFFFMCKRFGNAYINNFFLIQLKILTSCDVKRMANEDKSIKAILAVTP